MIIAKGSETPYLTAFTNGKFEAFSDAAADKGGQGAGFRPHELLEAALACCVNMWVRTYADHHEIPLEEATTTVSVKRDQAEESRFEYRVSLRGPLTDEQREVLMKVAETCPVRRTLSQKITFQAVPSQGSAPE